MHFENYQKMIQAGRNRPALWRLIAAILTVLAVSIIWFIAFVFLISFFQDRDFLDAMGGALELENQSPGAAVIYLIMVWGLGVGAAVAALIWSRRSIRSLTGPGGRMLRDFTVAALAAFCVIAAISLIFMPFSDPLKPNSDPFLWLVWLPLGLFAIAGQTFSEELLFRGYLQSQLAGRFANPAIWMIVPSILFGAVHFLPTLPFSAAMVYVSIAALFGLMAADLTARTGNIGAAWGFHFANNCIAILIVVTEGSITGLGLYQTPDTLGEQTALSPLLIFDALAMVGIWLVIRRLVRR